MRREHERTDATDKVMRERWQPKPGRRGRKKKRNRRAKQS